MSAVDGWVVYLKTLDGYAVDRLAVYLCAVDGWIVYLKALDGYAVDG